MMTTFDLPSDVSESLDTTSEVDGKRECDKCGKSFKVNADGSLRSHNCNGVRTVKRSAPAKGKRGTKRLNVTPESVQRVGTAAVASGIEWTATQLLASYIQCDTSRIPSEVTAIPDADEMVGPFVKFTFPQLPKKAQDLVASVCDHEDMIVCLMAWWDWSQRLREFATAAKEAMDNEKRQTGVSNGIQGPVGNVVTGSFNGVQPFVPATDTAM
jgi:hypothetical protein